MSEPELLQLIEQAKREGWTELDLSFEDLTELPEGIVHLTKLQSLYFTSNNLCTISDKLEQLTNLQMLDLNENNLSRSTSVTIT